MEKDASGSFGATQAAEDQSYAKRPEALFSISAEAREGLRSAARRLGKWLGLPGVSCDEEAGRRRGSPTGRLRVVFKLCKDRHFPEAAGV